MKPFHKKLLAGLIAGSLLMTGATPAWAKPKGEGHPGRGKAQERFHFADWQEDYWANESLSRLILKGVILGDGDTLAPQRTVTRLEAAIMLVRLLGLEPVAREGKWSGHMPGGKWEFKVDGREIKYEFKYRGEKFEFKWDDEGLKVESKGPQGKLEWHIRDGDLVPEWGRGYVQVALAQGFLVPNGNVLGILSPLNRLDATVMLVRAAGLEEAARAKAGAQLSFSDAGAIPAAYRGYVALAVENGLISGYPDGTFRAAALVTRAEWAALLDRFDRRAEVPVDEHQVQGTLLAINTGSQASITIATESQPNGRTYPVDPDVLVFVGGQEATLADLERGDVVIAQLNESGAVTFLVRTGHQAPAEEQVEGKVVALGQSQLVLQVEGNLAAYPLAANFTVYEGESRIRYSDLQVGDTLRLTLVDGKATPLERLNVELEAERSGRIESLNQSQGTLRLNGDDGQSPDRVTVRFGAESQVVFKDLALPAEVLAVGQQLLVAGSWDGSVLAAGSMALDAERSTLTFTAGLVERSSNADGSPRAVRVQVGSRTALLPVDAEVQVSLGGQRIPFAELQPGDTVRLTWNRSAVVALEVEERTEVNLTGRIDALDAARKMFRFGYDDATTRRQVMVDWNDQTTVQFQGLNLGPAALATGQELTLVGDLQEGRVLARSIELDAAAPVEFAAKVRSVGSAELGVQVGQQTADFPVAPDVQARIAGIPATLADLQPADGVTLKLSGGEVTEISVTDRAAFTLTGQLVGLNLAESSLRVRYMAGGTSSHLDLAVTLTAQTQVEYQGLVVTPGALQLGQELEVAGRLETGTVVAERIEILSLSN